MIGVEIAKTSECVDALLDFTEGLLLVLVEFEDRETSMMRLFK